MLRTAFGLRQPAPESTTRLPPAEKVCSACVSEPPTWNSGMPNSKVPPGLAFRTRLIAQAW